MTSFRVKSVFILFLTYYCQVILTIPLPSFIVQGLQKDYFRSGYQNALAAQLVLRAEQVTFKYCRPIRINDLVIQQVDDCLHKGSGLSTRLANKCDLRAYGMFSLNEQRMAKCAATDLATRRRTFIDCYIEEANRAAAAGDTRAQYQMVNHNNLLLSLTYSTYQQWILDELRRLLPCLEAALSSVPMPVRVNSVVPLTGGYEISSISGSQQAVTYPAGSVPPRQGVPIQSVQPVGPRIQTVPSPYQQPQVVPINTVG